MSGERGFVDTNVLVYLFDDDEPDKRAIARTLLGEVGDTFVLSAQVLGEFYVTVTRKLARPLSPEIAREAVASFGEFPVQPITGPLVSAAIDRVGRSRLSYRDALIVETAIAAGAGTLLTEDLQDGQDFDGVRVRNPFVA